MIRLILGALTSIFVVSAAFAQDVVQPVLRTDPNFCASFATARYNQRGVADPLQVTLSRFMPVPDDLTDLSTDTLKSLAAWAKQCETILRSHPMIAIRFSGVRDSIDFVIAQKARKDEATKTAGKLNEEMAPCKTAAASFREHNFSLLPTLQASLPNMKSLDEMSVASFNSLIEQTNSCYSRFYNELGKDGHDALRAYASALTDALAALKIKTSKLPQCDSNAIVALYKKSVTDSPLGKQGFTILNMNNVTTLGTSDDLKTKACQAQLFTNAGKMVSSFTIEFIDDKQIYLDVKSLDRAP